MVIPEIVQFVLGGGAAIGSAGLVAAGLIPTRWTNGAMRFSLAIAGMPISATAHLLLNASTGFEVVQGVAGIIGTAALLSRLLEYQKGDAALGVVGKSPLPRS